MSNEGQGSEAAAANSYGKACEGGEDLTLIGYDCGQTQRGGVKWERHSTGYTLCCMFLQ